VEDRTPRIIVDLLDNSVSLTAAFILVTVVGFQRNRSRP
jgi:hypothetical protein